MPTVSPAPPRSSLRVSLRSSLRSSLARTFAAIGLLAMGVVACSGSPMGPDGPPLPPFHPPHTLSQLKFAPDSLALDKGGQGQVTLVGFYADGAILPIADASWLVGDTSIVRLDSATHQATGRRGGQTTIVATKDGVNATLQVTVVAPFFIYVSPGADCMRLVFPGLQDSAWVIDTKTRLRLPDRPVTSWRSSDSTVMAVDQTGFMTPHHAGVANIIAEVDGEIGMNYNVVDPAPLGTPMTCTGLFSSSAPARKP